MNLCVFFAFSATVRFKRTRPISTAETPRTLRMRRVTKKTQRFTEVTQRKLKPGHYPNLSLSTPNSINNFSFGIRQLLSPFLEFPRCMSHPICYFADDLQ